jgi:hypothetical protein
MRPAQPNFLCRVTLAKTRTVSPSLGKCAEGQRALQLFQLGLVASSADFLSRIGRRISKLDRSRPRATDTMILHGRNYRPPDCLRDASAQRFCNDTSLQIGVEPGICALA